MSGGRIIRFIVIDADGNIEMYTDELTMKLAQGIVGGDFEAIQPADMQATMLVNTEGKRLGLLYNKLATKVARSRLRPSDFVVGTVVVTGVPDDDGELTELTDEALAAIKAGSVE